ncbi:RNA polymerase sigma factor [Streptomyces virginiae]|uniref:RNA polymerase sigma factor n=1 Tax=Streptomyces virginiae TaxID=1961 RepID=UPI0036DFD04C
MTLTSDFPCARTGCEQGSAVSCGTCPYGPTVVEVNPPVTPPLESVSPTILSAEFTAFHDSHRLVFVKYARSRGVQREEAEDVVNSAFLTLYRAGQAFLAADNREGFAFKVLRDTVADHFRRRSRRPQTEGLPDEPGDLGGGSLSRTRDRWAFQSASGPVRSTSASYNGRSPTASQSSAYSATPRQPHAHTARSASARGRRCRPS